jgi:lipooligosaccharide transport system permease protein
MNGAIYDSTMNIFFKLNHDRIYHGMLATSLGPLDVALGEIGLALLRGFLYGVGFMAVVAPLGLIPSLWGLLAIPAAVLIAFGFASVGMALTTYMKSFQQLEVINIFLLPMFLFLLLLFSVLWILLFLCLLFDCCLFLLVDIEYLDGEVKQARNPLYYILAEL